MYDTRKPVLLKDGTQAVLRGLRPGDGEAMLRFLKKTRGESEFLMLYPEEITQTVEQEENWIRRKLEDPNAWMIICEVNGEMVGVCEIFRNRGIKVRHRGILAVAVVKDFWRQGIGTVFFEEMEAVARQNGITQMELEVVEGNERAMALYEKQGFAVTGTIPGAMRYKDGRERCYYYMVKKL